MGVKGRGNKGRRCRTMRGVGESGDGGIKGVNPYLSEEMGGKKKEVQLQIPKAESPGPSNQPVERGKNEKGETVSGDYQSERGLKEKEVRL